MLYIITEDQNSAREFWTNVADEYKGSGNFKLVDLPTKNGKQYGGNTTLRGQFESILTAVNSADTIFIALDNVEAHNFKAVNFIRYDQSECKKIGVSLNVTSYYSFEELFLSYDELIELYKNSGNVQSVVLNALIFVNKSINAGINYYDIKNKEIADYIKYRGRNTDKNREKFANQLLLEVTNVIKGHFYITKSNSTFSDKGECWILDCTSIVSKDHNSHMPNNICGKLCTFICNGCNRRQKLDSLSDNSLCKYTIPLYNI